MARLLPLLESICCEIVERMAGIDLLERQRAWLARHRAKNRRQIRNLEEGVATHHRELGRAFQELRALDCMVIGVSPLTIRIVEDEGGSRRSYLWRSGRPALTA